MVGAIAFAYMKGDRLGDLVIHRSDEVSLLSIFGLALLVAGLAEGLNISAAVGAFLVGISLSGEAVKKADTAEFYRRLAERTPDPYASTLAFGLVALIALAATGGAAPLRVAQPAARTRRLGGGGGGPPAGEPATPAPAAAEAPAAAAAAAHAAGASLDAIAAGLAAVRPVPGRLELKRALEGVLPHDLLYEPKRGFGAPVREWFRGRELRGLFDARLMNSRLRKRDLLDYTFVGRML